jgi:hypothetical protein
MSLVTVVLAFAALTQSGTDHPHRDWGQVATLDMSITDATACIMRELGRNGEVALIPTEQGNDIDFALRVFAGKKMEPWLTFKLEKAEESTTLRVFYRRPFSAKGIIKQIERLQGRCLRVRAIESTNK